MNENNENSIKVTEKPKELFDDACTVVLATKEDNQPTKIASGRLRFLWKKLDGEYTKKQKEVQDWFEECIDNNKKLKFKVLLYNNLMEEMRIVEKMDAESKEVIHGLYQIVVQLLKIGSEVRYSADSGEKFRMVLHNKTIQLSVSEDALRPVVRGMYYEGKDLEDGLVKYFNAKFDQSFNNATLLELDSNDCDRIILK